MDFHSIFLFVFGKHIFTHWSETWRSAEDWLTSIEKDLMQKKTRVRRGSDFDKYDLKVHSGLFSSGQGLLAVEDHGGGKQFLRFKCQTSYSAGGYILSASLCALGVIAAVNGQIIVGAIFWLMFCIAVYRFLIETAGCLNSLYLAFKSLKVEELALAQKESVSVFDTMKKEIAIVMNGNGKNGHTNGHETEFGELVTESTIDASMK